MRFPVFFIVIVLVWAAAHIYVVRRILGPWEPSARIRKAIQVGFFLHFFVAPTIMFSGRAFRSAGALEPLKFGGFILMGAFAVLFTFFAIRDLLFFIGAKTVFRSHDPERRKFFERTSNGALATLATGLTAWGVNEALRVPRLEEVDVPIEGLPAALEGYKIAQLSDIHVGPTIKRAELAAMVEVANSADADMIAITGDMIDGHVSSLAIDVEPFQDLRSRDGVYYCTGNHEHYWNADEWIEKTRELGMIPLVNEHRIVERGGAKVLVAGVLDYSTRNQPGGSDPAGAIADAPAHDVSILLAHQPKSIHAAAEAGYTLQLSGHTHGGQFFPFSLVVGFVHPFSEGLGKQDNTHIYVNRGTGYWGPPLRTGVPSEITLLRLTRA